MKILKTAKYKKMAIDIYDMDDTAATAKFFVSIYDVERLYGGPEEGGWGYDHFTYTGESHPFKDEQEAINFARKRNREFRANNEKTVAKVEEYMGENETRTKPHYE